MSEHKDLRNPFPTHDAGSAFGVAVTMGSRRTNEAISRRRRVGISVLSTSCLVPLAAPTTAAPTAGRRSRVVAAPTTAAPTARRRPQ